MASMAAHHAEWLSLVDVSGPFLSVPVLKEALPNGLDAHDPHVAAEVWAALEQWADPDGVGLGSLDEVELHQAFVRFVLHEVLGFEEEVLRWDADATSAWVVEVPQVGVLTPDAVVVDGDDAAMLVSVVGPGVRVDEIIAELGTLTAQERMVEHLKATGLRIGLVTDGERWTLVSHQEGENPGFATWWSSLWSEEKITLQAFRTLLHQDRFVSMGADETIAGLLDRSAEDQREVTTKLGNQTLDAVEILIRTIDRIDHERSGALLAEVPVEELYDAAVTVMMRLIFLFYAEENDLLPVAEPLYNDRYAASTLRERLQAAADEHGEEVLESTHDGWPRLLATWRAVFGGVEHGDMVLAPYGGSLFDPDRYPFLEGRQPDTSWTTDAADPLPIDNRTVLHLLNALQTLDEGGQRRKLSFRALDVEQIGHVYEGMLDHTAARADGWVLGLSGTGGRDPEIELDHLESLDDKALFDFLKEQTGRTPATLKKWVDDDEADKAVTKFSITWAAAFADADLEARARRFAKLIRPDSTGAPTVFQPGSVYVADSSHRGATGTHYTPRSLTDEIVKHTLDPLVYIGPADGAPEDEWELRTPEEILDLKICDPACGSGAFLVQACRYLADAVVESNRTHQRRSDPITEDEVIDARRQVAERCLHGVDINPMACEMAKLSIWLLTLSNHAPFAFLDHAIRCGDSLLGIERLEQLSEFAPSPTARGLGLTLTGGGDTILSEVGAVSDRLQRLRVEATSSIQDVTEKSQEYRNIAQRLEALKVVADLLVTSGAIAGFDLRSSTVLVAQQAAALSLGGSTSAFDLRDRYCSELEDSEARRCQPFHWPLEFPDVFLVRRGFDAVIVNPPFLGSMHWKSHLGPHFKYLAAGILGSKSGKSDLAVVFMRRGFRLLRSGGLMGLLGPMSTAEGEAQNLGLARLAREGTIVRGLKGAAWPGAAQVRINKIWAFRGEFLGRRELNGSPVDSVPPSLDASFDLPEPVQLRPPDLWGFVGVNNVKAGSFVLTEGDPWFDRLRESELVRPYVSGEDIGRYPPDSYRRWVVSCEDMDLSTVGRVDPDVRRFLESVVQPARAAEDLSSYEGLADRWWQFWNTRAPKFERLRRRSHCVVLPKVAMFVLPARASTSVCFTGEVVVLEESRGDELAICRSTFFVTWLTTLSTAFGAGGGIRLSLRKGIQTFPLPTFSSELATLSDQWAAAAKKWCDQNGAGQTALQHAVNDPSADADEPRTLLAEIDGAVAAAYGWSDLDTSADFHRDGTGPRFGLSDETQREILRRVSGLNAQRSS